MGALTPRERLRPPRARELVHFFRPGSLRFKALVAVVMVVLSPAVWVWSTSLWDRGSIAVLKLDLRAAAEVSRGLAERGTFDFETVATNRKVNIRMYDGDTLVAAALHDGDRRWFHVLTDPWFGPDGRPHPVRYDDENGPILQREEVYEARETGRSSICGSVARGDLLVCAQIFTVNTPEGPRLLHVQRSVAQSVRALWADRFQMTQLTLVVLVFAILLTFWLGTRWVRPIESLRDQALARTHRGVSTEPLTIDRSDELGEVADAFNTLLSALEARNRANETFAADLAHELKNPIAAVRTAAEAITGGKPMTEARAQRLGRILNDSSQRMAVVIDRFLELARAEAGLMRAHVEPVDVRELVEALLESSRADARFEEVTFHLQVEGWPEPLPADPERLETALRNLLSNAASFACPTGRVDVVIRAVDDTLQVSVQDSGPGIAEDDLPRVFDRYFSKRQGGTGLGLALCKAIVEAHGGELVAESPPGSGAVFTATFFTGSPS